MSIAARVRMLLTCGLLQFGAVLGVPMRPDEIRELLHRMQQPKVARSLPSEDDAGDRLR